MSQYVSVPFEFWGSFIKYVDFIMWNKDDNAQKGGISFAELALDFEVVSGSRIWCKQFPQDCPWGKKAEIMRLMFKTACLYHSKYRLPGFSKKVKSLCMFGIQSTNGFNRRVRLMGGEHSKRLIVHNASKIEHGKGPGGRGCGPLQRTVDYSGLKVAPILRSQENRIVNQMIEASHPG